MDKESSKASKPPVKAHGKVPSSVELPMAEIEKLYDALKSAGFIKGYANPNVREAVTAFFVDFTRADELRRFAGGPDIVQDTSRLIKYLFSKSFRDKHVNDMFNKLTESHFFNVLANLATQPLNKYQVELLKEVIATKERQVKDEK